MFQKRAENIFNLPEVDLLDNLYCTSSHIIPSVENIQKSAPLTVDGISDGDYIRDEKSKVFC
jgi:hypothetical protein